MIVPLFIISAQENTNPQQNDVTTVITDESQIMLDNPSEQATPQTVRTDSTGLLIRLIIVLALAALAIYGVVYLLRKAGKPGEVHESSIRVLATTSLGASRSIHVVALGDRAWLIGASDGGVTPIAEIEDKETLDLLLLEESQKNAENNRKKIDFKGLFHQLTGSHKTTSTPSDIENTTTERLRKQRERLKRL